MKKILIFKTDRLGDLLNISPIINNLKLNFPDSKIDLICSEYNKSIAKYFSSYVNIIVYKKPFFFFLISNYKKFFINKYDLLIQLDGKNHSYLSSIFIKSKKKICIQFKKKKKILGKDIVINRPNNFIILFFTKSLKSIEDYNITNNKDFHYLSLYLNLISLIGIKIYNKEHFFPSVKNINISKFRDTYTLIHIDNRWDNFEKSAHDNIQQFILKFSEKNNIVISSNIGGNKLFNNIYDLYYLNTNIHFFPKPNINDVISLILHSKTCISSHAGLIVHLAASFKKKIIDIVPKNIFLELDRWVPLNSNYKRLDVMNFTYKDL